MSAVAPFAGGPESALLLAVLLGVRHATDPDHVAAVAMLGADPSRAGARAAGGLGLAWGLGHATTCSLLGLVVVVAGRDLPAFARLLAEALVGVSVAALAVRLLLRSWRGQLHAHTHRHGEVVHRHPHLHEPLLARSAAGVHHHGHAGRLGRTPLEAFGIGLVHGVGGSALAAALVASAARAPAEAVAILGCFAVGSVVAMAAGAALLGAAFDRAPRALALERVGPVLGIATLVLGVWVAGGALGQLMGVA